MRQPLPALALVLTLLLASGLGAQAKEKKKEKAAKPKPHTDLQMKEHKVLEKFKKGYAVKDIDDRMQSLRYFGRWRHKSVLKQLKKLWKKEKQKELLAIVAEGLGNQTPFKKDAGKALVLGLDERKKWATRENPEGDDELQQKLEARVLVSGIHALGTLGYRDGWDDVKRFIDHSHDDVAAEMMRTCATLKEYRSLKIIQEWFNYYPNGTSWSGGSVKVDTGAAGTKDQRAAKAKWGAKFGGRKRKARPMVWETMVEVVEALTGEKMSKPEELKAWRKKNKLFLKKHGA